VLAHYEEVHQFDDFITNGGKPQEVQGEAGGSPTIEQSFLKLKKAHEANHVVKGKANF
jgi:hypothetical protein